MVIVLCAVVAVLLIGGMIAATATTKTPSTPAAAPDYSQTSAAEPSPTPTPTPTNPSPVAFGPAHGSIYTDGLQVSVLSVRRYRIGPYAAGRQPGEVGVKVTVRITNRTAESFDLAVVQVNVKAGPDGTQASPVYDEGVNDFTGTVAVGHAVTATYAFGVLPAGLPMIDVEVTPGFTYTPITFEGAAA